MDYEQKYKQLHKFIIDLYPNMSDYCKEKVEEMIPELKESEDEMIRKFITNELVCLRASEENGSDRYEELTNAIVWLEKQGEQKPVDKTEPKFKIGDWVVYERNGNTYQIHSINNSDSNYIIYTCKPLSNTNSDWPCFHEDTIRLWTIQDAKDGDVLIANGTIFLFKNIIHNMPYSYCGIDCTARFRNCIDEGGKDGRNWISSLQDIYPATKEQRDLLSQKMKQAGYEWDNEKKELKKIEQKPAWNEEDEQYLLVCKNALAKYQSTDKWDANIISRWLESLKDRAQSQPKQEWSEEDEEMRKKLLFLMEEENSISSWEGCYEWLKSIMH